MKTERIHLFISLLFLFLMYLPSHAQKSKQWVKMADEAFEEKDFYGASLYYEKALSIDTGNLDLKYKIAESYRGYNQYQKAENQYNLVISNDIEEKYPLALFWLAMMQKSNEKYDIASENFTTFYKSYRDRSSYYSRKSKHEIKSCKFATRITADTIEIDVHNLGDFLNSNESEFNSVLLDDSTLYFTALISENENSGMIRKAGEPYKIKLFEAKKKNDKWNLEGELNAKINNVGYHNGNGTFSPDRKQFFFSRCDDAFNCLIYKSEWKNNEWSEPQILDNEVNLDGSNSTQPHYAKVGSKEALFFVSDRARGKGKLDIWYSEITRKKGKVIYKRPKNAGSKINTKDNEISPFYNDSTKQLYFSSTWHYGLGGFDIFKSPMPTLRSAGTPENIGYPFNTASNDMFYSIDKENKKGFLTSNRKGSYAIKGESCCNDIYEFEYFEEPIDTTDTSMYASLEKLNDYLPVTLYFHNDEPNPKTRDTLTKYNYLETFEAYYDMIDKYKSEYAKGLGEEAAQKAEQDIEDFFTDYAEKGVSDLKIFSRLLLKELKKGQNITLTVKGYASPLAKSDYNVNLTLRRISSMINYLNEHEQGVFKPYINKTAENGGTLDFKKIPFGEYRSDTTVSDNLNDKRNSVYSRKAALERKIEILSVGHTVTTQDSTQMDTTDGKIESAIETAIEPNIEFSESNYDFGEIPPNTKAKIILEYQNISDQPVAIKDIEASCGCTVPKYSKSPLAPGKSNKIFVIFDGKGKRGPQLKMLKIKTDKGDIIPVTISGNILSQ
ncbi:MAG: DUF1573 domain-containing protein [Flavobacteriales bacterium]|nr:DUF1573 domain-containing protein [Flavobacteriales bacterium]